MPDLLLFDADCGFCTNAAKWLGERAIDVDVVALQSVDLVELGVDPRRAQRQIPFRHVDGPVEWGADAIAAGLERCDGRWALAGCALRAPLVRPVAHLVYGLVAHHRHRLPGGTAACRLPGSG